MSQMTLYSFRNCKVFPQSEFLNVFAVYLPGQMISDNGYNGGVSHQCALLNVPASLMHEKKNDLEHLGQT